MKHHDFSIEIIRKHRIPDSPATVPVLETMNFVFKNDEICIQNDELCTQNDEISSF